MTTMPCQPGWFQRLGQILEEIEALPAGHLDRVAIERIFGVGERRARQLMAGLPGIQVGNAFAVDRRTLIDYLKSIRSGEAYDREVSRRLRVIDHLEESRKHLAARRVSLPVTPVPKPSIENLGDGITLTKGELRLRFKTAEELAAKLFELAQAMANDWPSIVQKINVSSGV